MRVKGGKTQACRLLMRSVSDHMSLMLTLRLTLIDKVRKEYPILKDYERDWPTRDMLKLHLKYTSEAARRSVAASTAKDIEKVCQLTSQNKLKIHFTRL